MKLCCRRCDVEWIDPHVTTCWSCGRKGETGFIRNSIPSDSGLRSTRLARTLDEHEAAE